MTFVDDKVYLDSCH